VADQYQALTSLVAAGHPFVRQVTFKEGMDPCMLLYLNESITDLESCLRNGQCIVGVDKTFNMGKVFVTALNYKNTGLFRATTRSNPIFIGPIFIHGTSTKEAFDVFFREIASLVASSQPIPIGSDGESALVQSIKNNFPDCIHLKCILHVKANVEQKLDVKLRVSSSVKRDVTAQLFDPPDGIVFSGDKETYDARMTSLTSYTERAVPNFLPYVNNRLRESLWDSIVAPRLKLGLLEPWTNNNAESANNIMKAVTDYRPKKLPELVDKLHQLVSSQFVDVERALYGQGEFRIADLYIRYRISYDVSEAPQVALCSHVSALQKRSLL